ncbi:conserved hypothetical protein [Neospora caninum Liverpool]|uniref:Transmembrane protein n=1 Tax=Neospora caninum (strain Liverpool) TaxID=572307 RepID=F0VKE0_NEOCL|nr:conserved hypothetical protein [Neospora caninum Liverpool]CBZ54541.1 conserved hypothetical protein [Neospora caninum Liverpool]CEL69254.1 TPA: hypothetical protein BN1204_049700 [Neospora caninum Liverpool]|eukprot:XP_003884571.1 conserved hypothetical protein [Neospora caninum Liverpool]
MDYSYSYAPFAETPAGETAVTLGTYENENEERKAEEGSPSLAYPNHSRVPRVRRASRRRAVEQGEGSFRSYRTRKIARGAKVDPLIVAAGLVLVSLLAFHGVRQVVQRATAPPLHLKSADGKTPASSAVATEKKDREAAQNLQTQAGGVHSRAVGESTPSKNIIQHFFATMPWGKFVVEHFPVVLALYSPVLAITFAIASFYLREVPGAMDKVLGLFRKQDVTKVVANAKVLLGSTVTTLESLEELQRKNK